MTKGNWVWVGDERYYDTGVDNSIDMLCEFFVQNKRHDVEVIREGHIELSSGKVLPTITKRCRVCGKQWETLQKSSDSRL